MNKPYGLTKIQEDKDGRKMLGGGCKTCPVIACATSTYRGSACASQRASHGLGDPMTNADRIRSMTDEELAEFIATPCVCDVDSTIDGYRECGNKSCIKHLINWLKMPYKEKKE